MAHYTMIEEGTYPIDAAFLFTDDYSAVPVDDGFIEVYLNGNNERRLRGSGHAFNRLIVALLEDHDDMDLLLDLGETFKYRLKAPSISAGRSLDVKGLIHFVAESPLEKLDRASYDELRSRLHLLTE